MGKIEENGTSVLREQRILDGEYFVMGSIQHVGMGARDTVFFYYFSDFSGSITSVSSFFYE